MTYTSPIFPPKMQCVAQVHTLILISFRFCDPDNTITMYPQLPTFRVALHAGLRPTSVSLSLWAGRNWDLRIRCILLRLRNIYNPAVTHHAS